jgi:hypothetical protein
MSKILFLGIDFLNCLGGVKHLANVSFVAEREREKFVLDCGAQESCVLGFLETRI